MRLGASSPNCFPQVGRTTSGRNDVPALGTTGTMVTGSCRLSAGSINPMDSSDIRCNMATFAATQRPLDSTSALNLTSALDSFAKP